MFILVYSYLFSVFQSYKISFEDLFPVQENLLKHQRSVKIWVVIEFNGSVIEGVIAQTSSLSSPLLSSAPLTHPPLFLKEWVCEGLTSLAKRLKCFSFPSQFLARQSHPHLPCPPLLLTPSFPRRYWSKIAAETLHRNFNYILMLCGPSKKPE